MPSSSTERRGARGERREIVAGERRRLRELAAGELHAVARIAGEADDDGLQLLTVWTGFLKLGCGHGRRGSSAWMCQIFAAWMTILPTIRWEGVNHAAGMGYTPLGQRIQPYNRII